MGEKFQNKYRIPSARLQNWDYGTNGAYFITICSKDMKHFFGEVADGKMSLNAIGKLAEEYWIEIVKQFPYVELGNFQIMPNHMHGILIIDKIRKSVETRFIASNLDNDDYNVETRLIASVPPAQEIGGFSGENNPMLSENIARIIRWYKGRCTFEMRKINENFEWHSRFHDHIIRNSDSFERILNYIEKNPSKWEEDKFYKK
jgi:REP element-mobilizing transposase RayT